MPYVHLASIVVQSSFGPPPHTTRYRVLGSCYCGSQFDRPITDTDAIQGILRVVGDIAEHITSHVVAGMTVRSGDKGV